MGLRASWAVRSAFVGDLHLEGRLMAVAMISRLGDVGDRRPRVRGPAFSFVATETLWDA